MTEGYELQDGIFVREDGSGIAIENTWKLGSSNRILRLGASACQRLLDFLIEGAIDDLPSSARAAQLQRAVDPAEQSGDEPTNAFEWLRQQGRRSPKWKGRRSERSAGN